MSDSPTAASGAPDPGRVTGRQDFARELTALREQAGLTVRQVAARVGARGPHSTIGDWFAGRGLPSTSSRDLLVRVLEVCGVTDPGHVERWLAAWRRVRRAPGRRPAGPEPYRGLASYQVEDAGWFFGRRDLTGRLLARLAALREAGGGVQVVIGPSGSGKSSLLRAGMAAALRADALPGSREWPLLLAVPGKRPVDELSAWLAERAGVPREEVAAAIRADPGSCARYARRAAGGGTAVVVVDQFEEVFTQCADDERACLVAALRAAGSPEGGALVVIGLRADFYAQALRSPPLAAVLDGQLAVGPMAEAGLREAITEPARKARTEIEDGLVELLLREVTPRGGVARGEGAHDPGVLPLLSHALYATWRQGGGRELTVAAYHAVGGIDGAVAASAGAVYDELTEGQRELARHLFLQLVHVAADTADTRRRVPVAELLAGHDGVRAAELEEVFDRFVGQRLITAGADTAELSHEALLRAWPRLREWLDADRAGLVVGRALTAAASAWHRDGRDTDALYRGARLVAAQEWAAAGRRELPPTTKAFLEAGVRHARRRTRRLYQTIAALGVLLALALAASGVALRAERTAAEAQRAATRQRDVALSQKVAGETGALRVTDPALAAQLSLAGYRLAPTAEARGGLLGTLAGSYATRLTGHSNAVYATAYRPDGRLLATASLDQTVRLWDVADPHRPGVLATVRGHTAGVLAVAFSPDGRTLATAGDDRTARLWDVSDPRRPRPVATLGGHAAAVRQVAFAPDGRALATAGYDGTARLWDVAGPGSPRTIATLSDGDDLVTSVAFGPDGRTVATVGNGATARLWDVADPRRPRRLAALTGHTAGLLSAAFSPDGRVAATGGFDNTVRLWDVRDPRRPRLLTTLAGHGGGVAAVAFSRDGRAVATGGYDMSVRLWDLTDPRSPGTPVKLAGHGDTVLSLAFGPGGDTLASASRDGTARLWDLRVPVLGGHGGTVFAVAFSPDGRTLATADHTTVRLWSMDPTPTPPGGPRAQTAAPGDARARATPTVGPGTRTAAPGDVRALATSPVGPGAQSTAPGDVRARATPPGGPRPLAAPPGAPPGVATLPGRPGALGTLAGHADGVMRAVFRPDGRVLATASLDFTVRLWDVADPGHPEPLASIDAHTDNAYAAAFSPDGRVLATVGADRALRLWDAADPRRPRRLASADDHAETVLSVAFAPGGRVLATGSADRAVRLWDVSDPRRPAPLATLTGHTNAVNDVVFSPDGRSLASGAADGTVRLWDVTAPRRSRGLATLTGHTNAVTGLAFRPDGRALASTALDTTVRLWDLTRPGHPDAATTLSGHADRVYAVAFAPDGHTLATGGVDATVRLWETDPERAAARVCALAHPRVSRADWSRHLRDVPYRPPCP
ncbi:helix-turn-helix domain-containing protein [Sphaerisporangium sp. TRM90804]|uniref:nSTAND1 domain-containing NTPase n=1 Tax=Sphaerisporangium sp. TRM90804 TaxID=3031113 RepID=UPI00244A1384|nr:helix-turn-helix domain-containing protein [Sphaerisporangium sp. TRM90804]MDH2424959.1 helix-turn-helix domain-containing protein [Sphaerisporangium sp. TRM90804]